MTITEILKAQPEELPEHLRSIVRRLREVQVGYKQARAHLERKRAEVAELERAVLQAVGAARALEELLSELAASATDDSGLPPPEPVEATRASLAERRRSLMTDAARLRASIPMAGMAVGLSALGAIAPTPQVEQPIKPDGEVE